MQNKHSRKEFSSSSVQRRRMAALRWSCTNTSHNWTEYELRRYEEVRRWLQLWFDFDSTLVRRARRTAYQRSSSAKWRNRLAAASHAELFTDAAAQKNAHAFVTLWRRMHSRRRITVERQSNRSCNHRLTEFTHASSLMVVPDDIRKHPNSVTLTGRRISRNVAKLFQSNLCKR